jgi:cell division protease FtsH
LEQNQTLLQLMKEMESRVGVILLATTNRPDLLDPALFQPARFERIIQVGPPDEGERQSIFDVHLRGRPLAADVDSAALARVTPGFTGAHIAVLVNEAALLAVRHDKQEIGSAEFEAAVERVAAG